MHVSTIDRLDLGRLLFSVGLLGLGALTLLHGDFALTWQPMPEHLPARHLIAYLSGLFLVAGGAGLSWRRTAEDAARGLTLYLFVFWVLPQALLRVVPAPSGIGRWLGFCESLAAMTGAWTLMASMGDERNVSSPTSRRAARILFGASCVVFGAAHFKYADFTADMIPAALPYRMFLAHFTGVCHAAAGIAILSGVAARTAATLEGVMLSSFVLLVHAPSLFARPAYDWAPTARLQWTPLFWALLLSGAAWSVAGSLSRAQRSARR